MNIRCFKSSKRLTIHLFNSDRWQCRNCLSKKRKKSQPATHHWTVKNFIHVTALKLTSLFKFIFIFRDRRRVGERERCGCLVQAPNWGPRLQPRHVPWLGIKPVTLWFAGQHSIHWATPARAEIYIIFPLLLFGTHCSLPRDLMVLVATSYSPHPIGMMNQNNFLWCDETNKLPRLLQNTG